jgi:hypothetical protein
MSFTGRLLCWALNLGALAGALGVVVAEGRDLDGNGTITAHEALLVGVRLLAFPVHIVLRFAPAELLGLLGIPEGARWPSSAALAVAVSLPLWGVFIIGSMAVGAWLEVRLEARRGRAQAAGPGGELLG